MQIHTVADGESLYGIARKYSTPATKILADNDLIGDRLTIGDKLLILKPTRTVTVKGGDTLDTIAERFGVKRRSLLCSNPALFGKTRLRPGQILTVKEDNSYIGVGSALGFIKKGCRHENLTRSLPYITYTTVEAAVIREGGVSFTFDYSTDAALSLEAGKITLLGLRDETQGGFLAAKESYGKVLDAAISLARSGGFMGITISAKDASENRPEAFCEFLLEGRKRLIGCDMILFTEIFENSPTDASEISDGAILNVRDDTIAASRKALEKFSESAESSKVFVRLTSECNIKDSKISINEAKELCYRSGKLLSTDEKTLISGFEYTRYKSGLGEKVTISFPSLDYTREKLGMLCELGFMGISFDIDTLPMSSLAMFNSLFAKADYSLT